MQEPFLCGYYIRILESEKPGNLESRNLETGKSGAGMQKGCSNYRVTGFSDSQIPGFQKKYKHVQFKYSRKTKYPGTGSLFFRPR
jgi:hypothetical protein